MKPFPIDTQKKDESQPPVYSLLAPFLDSMKLQQKKRRASFSFFGPLSETKHWGYNLVAAPSFSLS